MTHAEVASALVLVPLVIWDLRWRRVPNWLVVLLTVEVLVADWFAITPWSWMGFVVAAGLGLLADVPGGDLKAMMLLGGSIGLPAIVWIVAGAFTLTGLAWIIETSIGRRPRPPLTAWLEASFSWPWVPLLALCFVGYVALSHVL
jgi:Flp pilus assembly protein protease CpaA